MLLKLLAVAVIVNLAVAEIENETANDPKLVLTQIVWRFVDQSVKINQSDTVIDHQQKCHQTIRTLKTNGLKDLDS